MRPQIAIFVAIIIASLLTALISYQAATSAANTVTDLTLQQIRSNAEIEASDLSNILANKIDAVTTNLQVISASDEVQKQDLNKTAVILDEGQKSTAELTSYYMWIDKDGKILLRSNLDAASMQKYRGTDLSHREYFIKPKETLEHYFSKVVDSIGGRPRVYLSYPILSPKVAAARGGSSGAIDVGRFKGAIIAAVDLQDLGAFLQSQIPAKYKSSVILMDRGGVILYAQNVTLIGKSISRPELQSQLIPLGRQFQDSFNSFLAESQRG